MTRFWSVVDIWEVKRISESLKFTGISSEKANWLQSTPQPVLYHILSRAAALQDEFILSVISCDVKPPSRDFQWLKGPCLPGIFLLLNHKSQTVRTWARATLEKADLFTEDRFTVDHEASLCAVLKVLTEKDVQGNAGPISVSQAAASLRKNFPFSQSLEDLWMGLSFIIRLLPATVLTRLNIPHIVFGHVHDTGKGKHALFLQCFYLIFRQSSPEFCTRYSASFRSLERIYGKERKLTIPPLSSMPSRTTPLTRISFSLSTIKPSLGIL